jgi:hypothetical protein
MKNIIIITSISSLVIASIWMYKSNFDYEPILAVLGIVIVLFGYFVYENRSPKIDDQPYNEFNRPNQQNIVTNINPVISVNPSVNMETRNDKGFDNKIKNENSTNLSREQILDLMKEKTKILFVDDDTKFNLVKILKESGWRHTSSIKDIKTLDSSCVKNSNILFIDIHGVGKLLNCKSEGLDLAQMVKQKYPEKKVVIYSADSQGNIFHEGLKLADNVLEKNALPYQFQVIVERYSVDAFSHKINS